jgi:hypothetical protein
MPNIVYSENWNVDLGAPDNSVAASRVTSPVYEGAGALRINPAASVGYWSKNTPGADSNVIVYLIYVRFDDFPANDLFKVLDTTVNAVANCGLGYDVSSNQFGTWDGGGTLSTGGPTLVLGTWYRLDLRVNMSANPWVIDAKVNGANLPQETVAAVASTLGEYALGSDSSVDTWDGFFDYFFVSYTSSDYPIMFTEGVPPAPFRSGGASAW